MKKYFVKNSLLIMAGLLWSGMAMAQNADAIEGVWWNAEKTAKVQIYDQNGKYFGKIIHLEEPLDDSGNPKTDKENPNDKLRKRKMEGLVILTDLEHEGGNEYDEGEIYDPKSGKTYSASAELVGNDQLDLRGYIGFSLIGRTSTWTRAE